MKKRYIVIAVALAIFATMVIFSFNKQENTLLNKYKLTGLNEQELVKKLEAYRPSDNFNASIFSDRIEFTEGDIVEEIKLDSDKFYLSFAPYISSTHPCNIHSLSGCQAEFPNEEFQVTVVDENGEKLINQKMITYDNGFIGIWLPRNFTGEIYVGGFDKSVIVPITTYTNSPTCLTTPLQLT